MVLTIFNFAGNFFRRSCLQVLEAKIAPILAGIIAYLDTNHNLDLVKQTTSPWKPQLWLAVLSSQEVLQLTYEYFQVSNAPIKSRLLFSSAEILKKPLWQTVWTQIILLLYRSSLFWVHAVCFYTYFVSNARQLFAADDFSRLHFQMHFFSWRLRASLY